MSDPEHSRNTVGMPAWHREAAEKTGTPLMAPAPGQRMARVTTFALTKEGDTVFAILLNWPDDGVVTIKSMAKGSEKFPKEIKKVALVGSAEKLKWAREADGLTVTLPSQTPCEYAFVGRCLNNRG